MGDELLEAGKDTASSAYSAVLCDNDELESRDSPIDKSKQCKDALSQICKMPFSISSPLLHTERPIEQ